MPGPWGLPRVSVSPEVSECSRMPLNRRPASSATSACPASCTMVITLRAGRHSADTNTTTSAMPAVTSTTASGGSVCGPKMLSHTTVTRRAGRR
jgi:hypothetical protein